VIDNLVWKSDTAITASRGQALSVMEHHASRQIASLQEQANVLIIQAQAIRDRVKLAYSIEEAIYNFEPVAMKEYSLYEHKGTLILTLIEPYNSPPYDKFLITVRKLGDSTWEEVTKE
jgi:hypothetical protein